MDANHSPDAARKVLQRGLRINGDSAEMWIEYVKMEMWFAEVVRRRSGVLGIQPDKEHEALVDVVKVVIKSALKNLIPEWREKLRSAVATYPIPDNVRDRFLVLFQ